MLTTKLYGDLSGLPHEGEHSALNIRRAFDAGLTRLQMDPIDVYQFHHIDRNTPWDEIWQAVETAVVQGKILYAGSSNFAGLVGEQPIYNLLTRDIELEVIASAVSNGLGIIPWLLHQPAVTAPIVDPRTRGQLAAAVRALMVSLDAVSLTRLDKIFPGRWPTPGHYAW